MLLIPELETVVILVPRVASTALKNAILARYPKAVLLYRHMEADGVPYGYDRWPKVGLVRDPLSRLWNLYCYLRDMKQEANWVPGYAERMNESASVPFDYWLVNNTTVFTNPYVAGGSIPGYWPRYAVKHQLPENRKSQFIYLRPDLGTEIYRHVDFAKLCNRLKIDVPAYENTCAADNGKPPVLFELGKAAREHVQTTFAWDLDAMAHLPHRTPNRWVR